MPSNASELIWTLLGFLMLSLATYMLTTRAVIPRFGSGWLNRRDRQRAIDRGEALLASRQLDDNERYELARRINSLRARGSQRELWGNQVADRITVQEIHEICDRIEGADANR